MKFVFATILLCVAFSAFASADEDNRIKPLKLGYAIFSDPAPMPDEATLCARISAIKNPDLQKALGMDASGTPSKFIDLKWQQRIALKDADYILCLFDSEARVQPGDNPRVLVLFTPGYKLKAWAKFTCEPAFAFGTIVNRLNDPRTYFVTVNPATRFGGELYFEKYLIAPGSITKLGEGFEITKIRD